MLRVTCNVGVTIVNVFIIDLFLFILSVELAQDPVLLYVLRVYIWTCHSLDVRSMFDGGH